MGQALETALFNASFGTTGEEHAAAYRDYDGESVFFVVVDHLRSVPVGVARILPAGGRQKSVEDLRGVWGARLADAGIPGFHEGSGPLWDVATLAVDPTYRGPLVTQAPYQLVCTSANLAGVRWLIAVLDTRVYRLFRWQLREMFAAIPRLPVLEYGGSPSVPCWCDLQAYTRRIWAADRDFYELLMCGAGLEAAVSPPRGWSEEELAGLRCGPGQG